MQLATSANTDPSPGSWERQRVPRVPTPSLRRPQRCTRRSWRNHSVLLSLSTQYPFSIRILSCASRPLQWYSQRIHDAVWTVISKGVTFRRIQSAWSKEHSRGSTIDDQIGASDVTAKSAGEKARNPTDLLRHPGALEANPLLLHLLRLKG